MPKRKTSSNTNGSGGRLEEALGNLAQAQASLVQAEANLVANQSTFVANQAAFQANLTAQNAQNTERFARIEVELSDIRAILLRHAEILQSLPEAIRQKIGFEAR